MTVLNLHLRRLGLVFILSVILFGCGKMPVRWDLEDKAKTDAEFASFICGYSVKGLSDPVVNITDITYGGDPSEVIAVITGQPVGAEKPASGPCHAKMVMDWEMAHRSRPMGCSGSVGLYKNFQKLPEN